MIYIEDLYKAAIDFVRTYKKTKYKSQRPQSFAVLDQFSDLESSNYNKVLRDKHKPYFYSKLWEKNKFNKSNLVAEEPLLAFFSKSIPIKNPFDKVKEITYNIEIAYLDRYDHKCANKSNHPNPYESRTRNEIFDDTMMMFLEFLQYLTELKYYDVTGSDVFKSGLYHPELINIRSLTAVEDVKKTRFFIHGLRKNNQNIIVEHWDGGVRDLYGVFASLNVNFPRCSPSLVYDFENNQIIDRGDQGKR